MNGIALALVVLYLGLKKSPIEIHQAVQQSLLRQIALAEAEGHNEEAAHLRQELIGRDESFRAELNLKTLLPEGPDHLEEYGPEAPEQGPGGLDRVKDRKLSEAINKASLELRKATADDLFRIGKAQFKLGEHQNALASYDDALAEIIHKG